MAGVARKKLCPAPAASTALAMLALAAATACGGRVRSPTEPAAGGPGAQAFTFAQIQAGIFTPSCAKSGCHTSAAASGGLVLEAGHAYANIVGRPAQEQPQLDYVRPGNPDASYLLEKLRGDAGISGSRMPRDGPPFLTPQQIASLAAWIQAGAPDN
ncbi:MAG: hypothetical protein JOZ15_08545 [Acidobacteria bacterium]|nr:hypothetical protein [Acidobacteriota bacterium]